MEEKGIEYVLLKMVLYVFSFVEKEDNPRRLESVKSCTLGAVEMEMRR